MIRERFETHFHSDYSNIRIVDSINRIEPSLKRAAEIGLRGIALTDHETLSGHVKWLKAEKTLKEKGILSENFKCALGNEIYLTETRENKQQYFHAILIAKDKIGYRQLKELSSNAWYHSYKYRVERVPTLKSELEEKIKENPGHLIFQTACLGGELATLVSKLIEAEKENNLDLIQLCKIEIDNFIEWIKDLFGQDGYIEIAPGTTKEQIEFNQRIKPIADFYNMKIVIGTDAHFLSMDKQKIHEAFLKSKDGDRDVDSFYKDAWLMDADTIYDNLAGIYGVDEIEKIFLNSIEIYNKIESFDIFHKPIIPEVEVRNYNVRIREELKQYPTLYYLFQSTNLNDRYWINRCVEVLEEKKPWLHNEFNEVDYYERLETEADILHYISEKLETNMFSYFNTFESVIDLFWECGSVVGPGRGSSCSFLSNFLMGITQLDPLVYELPWFRFLNKERAELPD